MCVYCCEFTCALLVKFLTLAPRRAEQIIRKKVIMLFVKVFCCFIPHSMTFNFKVSITIQHSLDENTNSLTGHALV